MRRPAGKDIRRDSHAVTTPAVYQRATFHASATRGPGFPWEGETVEPIKLTTRAQMAEAEISTLEKMGMSRSEAWSEVASLFLKP